MNRQTQVKSIRVRSRAARLEGERIQPTEWTPKKSWGRRIVQLDRLARNMAVVAGLFLLVVAVRNSTAPEAQSVFGAIQQSASMEWDESLGKLSFVGAILPESVRAVWQETPSVEVFAPVSGSVVHAWSRAEPYLMIESTLSDVRAAADGEVMSIAHGVDEERIVRIRHDDTSETLYGNLQECYVQVGDLVLSGDPIGSLISEKPLAFELRVEGRSVDPSQRLLPMPE